MIMGFIHANFGQKISFMRWASWKLCDLNLTFEGHPRSKVLNTIYDFLYVFLINFGDNMIGLWNIIPRLKLHDLDLPFQFHQRLKVTRYKLNSYIWHTIYVFYTNFDHKCIIYEIQYFESYVTLIWPLNIINGHELKDHIWLCICLS